MRTLSVCPVVEIAAPLDEVWSLLVNPEKLDLWWEVKLRRANPAGPMAPGQYIEAGPPVFFKDLRIRMIVKEVDHAQHRLRAEVSFPLGITDRVTITCTPLGTCRTRASFG